MILVMNSDLSDNNIEEVIVLLYEKNGRFIERGEEGGREVLLGIGEYEYLVQVRHENLLVLEKLKDMHMMVNMKTNISVPVRQDFISGVVSGHQFSDIGLGLNPGESAMMVVGPALEAVPTDILSDHPGNFQQILTILCIFCKFYIFYGMNQPFKALAMICSKGFLFPSH